MSNAASAPGSAGSAGAGDNAQSGTAIDNAEIQKLVQEAVSKALGPRLAREREREAKERQEAIEKMVSAALEKATPQNQQSTQPAEDKTVAQFKAQIEALKKQVEEDRKARIDAEERARDVRVRSAAHDALAKQIGADNPHLPAYLTMLHDSGKRFVDVDGQVMVKFKNGEFEEAKPLDEGVKELFKTELKHLTESRTQSMPRTVRGQPMQSNHPGNNNRLDKLMNSIVSSLPKSTDDPGFPE